MNHLRQQDIIDPRLLEREIHIVGCGSVGSWTALTLAKMGASRLVLWDFDRVEEHNIPNQLYRPADVGCYKVDALADIIEMLTGMVPETRQDRCDGSTCSGIVVIAVDNMEARIDLWRALRSRPVTVLIDSRMGAEVARIFTVQVASLREQRDYGRTLYRSTEALNEPCTARATAYCATGLAAFLAAKMTKVVTAREYSRELTIDFRNALVLSSRQLSTEQSATAMA